MKIWRWVMRLTPLAVAFTVVVLVVTLLPVFDPYRQSFTVTMVILAPVILIYLEQRRALADNMDANLIRVIEALIATREIMDDKSLWNALPRRTRLQLTLIEDQLAAVATHLQGFRELAETRKELLAEMREMEF
jgi:hypothetical protein